MSFEIKGWCPGAHRPMMSGDGLVVRVRPRLARLSADQVQALCAAAMRHGAGLIDLTNRANLAQLIIAGMPAGTATLYVDNVYLYDAVTVAPTPSASAAAAPSAAPSDATTRCHGTTTARSVRFS